MERDGMRGGWALLGLGGVVLAGWLSWFGLARVEVYARSVEARVDGGRVSASFDAADAGRVREGQAATVWTRGVGVGAPGEGRARVVRAVPEGDGRLRAELELVDGAGGVARTGDAAGGLAAGAVVDVCVDSVSPASVVLGSLAPARAGSGPGAAR